MNTVTEGFNKALHDYAPKMNRKTLVGLSSILIAGAGLYYSFKAEVVRAANIICSPQQLDNKDLITFAKIQNENHNLIYTAGKNGKQYYWDNTVKPHTTSWVDWERNDKKGDPEFGADAYDDKVSGYYLVCKYPNEKFPYPNARFHKIKVPENKLFNTKGYK